MSLATDSPVSSSSSDDFASFLAAELDSSSSDPFPVQVAEDDYGSDTERIKKRKVELESIDVPQVSTSNGSLEVKSAETSTKSDMCTHPASISKMCVQCGRIVDERGVAFEYIIKGLELGSDEIARLRKMDLKNLLRHKKLYLILDLDHTLLNSTQLGDLSPEEEYLKSQPDPYQGSLFKLDLMKMKMMTKLRPFVHTFLREASSLFEMYIYTMGERSYAQQMTKWLDPEDVYFKSKVISHADCTHTHEKGLDVVLGQENAVLILDDTENVWKKNKDNLILMERYHFFASSCHRFGFNSKSLSETKSDENESDGALTTVLKILKRSHSMFYDSSEFGDHLDDRDVRQILKAIKKAVLGGCKIVFSRVIPTNSDACDHPLWLMAEELGATCVVDVDPLVTHVVSTDTGTEKSRWAVKEKKFLVHPRWLEAARYLWEKQPEDKFPVS